MSKSGSFTLVLTVICLSVLTSLEADAQSTTDVMNSCSSSSLEEVVNLVKIMALNHQENAIEIKKIASNQKENTEDIKNVKLQFAANSSVLEEVVNLVKIIALNQQQNANKIKDVKELLAGNSSVLKEMANTVKRIESKQEKNELEPSKQALVSALISEYIISISFFTTKAYSKITSA